MAERSCDRPSVRTGDEVLRGAGVASDDASQRQVAGEQGLLLRLGQRDIHGIGGGEIVGQLQRRQSSSSREQRHRQISTPWTASAPRPAVRSPPPRNTACTSTPATPQQRTGGRTAAVPGPDQRRSRARTRARSSRLGHSRTGVAQAPQGGAPPAPRPLVAKRQTPHASGLRPSRSPSQPGSTSSTPQPSRGGRDHALHRRARRGARVRHRGVRDSRGHAAPEPRPSRTRCSRRISRVASPSSSIESPTSSAHAELEDRGVDAAASFDIPPGPTMELRSPAPQRLALYQPTRHPHAPGRPTGLLKRPRAVSRRDVSVHSSTRRMPSARSGARHECRAAFAPPGREMAGAYAHGVGGRVHLDQVRVEPPRSSRFVRTVRARATGRCTRASAWPAATSAPATPLPTGTRPSTRARTITRSSARPSRRRSGAGAIRTRSSSS